MSIVKDRQTYYIADSLAGTGMISKLMNINEADEIRIVQLIYVNGGADVDGVFRVAWNGVVECFALFDIAHQSGNVNIRHNVHNKSLQGKQNFSVYNYNGTLATGLTGEIGIVFETVKY